MSCSLALSWHDAASVLCRKTRFWQLMGETKYPDTYGTSQLPTSFRAVTESGRYMLLPHGEKREGKKQDETYTHTQSWCILSEKQTQTKQHCILWLAGGSHTSTVTIVTAVPVEKGFGSILEASVWLNGCQEARWMMTCKSPTDRHTSHRGTLKSNTGLVYVCVFGHKCFYSMY